MFRRTHPFSSLQIDSAEIAAILSSFVRTSRHGDPLEVDSQAEGEHLVARPEEEELVSSNLEGEEGVRTTFPDVSITKLQTVIRIQGDGCQSSYGEILVDLGDFPAARTAVSV